MIKFENPNGYIEITNAYFATLVGLSLIHI